jgi:hypothetical protein
MMAGPYRAGRHAGHHAGHHADCIELDGKTKK